MGCGSSTSEAVTKAGDKKDKSTNKRDNEEYAETMSFLAQVPLFKRLPRDHHPLLAAACQPAQFKTNETILKQGDVGNAFFVIRAGEASVHITNDQGESKNVATLKVGDYFGEAALLRDDPRNATLIADSPLSTLKITRERFQELALNEKLQFVNRKAVGAGGQRQILAQEPSPKTAEERMQMAEALRNCTNLRTMVALDDQRIMQMIDVSWKETVQAGTEIITEGDLVADFFYIVQDGNFEVLVTEGNETNAVSADDASLSRGESKHLTSVGRGGCFGELALLYLAPRAATVVARATSTVWVIDRTNFKSILMKASSNQIEEYMGYLSKVEILAPLLKEERRAVAEALLDMHFQKGEDILLQGERGNTFYILYEGDVSIIKDGTKVTTLSAMGGAAAQFFGEHALLKNEQRNATVRVSSKTAKALALDRDSFNLLLGPLEDIIAKQGTERGSALQEKKRGPANALFADREKIVKKDLLKLGLLGCGGFGAVELYEHRTNGQTYALKSLSKGYVVKAGMQESVMNEKNIMLMTNSPFIVKLFETYNGQQTLYFLMEPALGGELYATYNRRGFHGSEKHALFYVAGVVFGFEHLHERRIIYRDLKPENLLLNETGHIKITDMGLAKFVIGKTYTTCGTPDYFAPEVIASIGHTNAVDWWTLGILTFELMSGHPPFESAYPMQIYSKVMKGISKVPFPPKCQNTVGDFIKSLLKREPSERLAVRPGGTTNIKEHNWYKNASFDWDAMKNLTLQVPYKPLVKSKKDKSNFSARKEDLPTIMEYIPDGSGWDKDFAT